jgi:hypothetical protein
MHTITQPDYIGYEAAKGRWIKEHPDATPQQYEAEMMRLARLYGV